MKIWMIETPEELLAPNTLRRAIAVAPTDVDAIQAVHRCLNGARNFRGFQDTGGFRRTDFVGCEFDEDECVVTELGDARRGVTRVLSLEVSPSE